MAVTPGESDAEQQSFLVAGAIDQLSTEGNEFARAHLLANPNDFEVLSALVPACALTGQDFPELPQWRKALSAPVRSRLKPPPEPLPPYRGPAPLAREDTRVGRNDPCPCGSGKKFKKCCLPRAGDA